MRILLSTIFAGLVLAISAPAHAATVLSVPDWETLPGDEMIVDVANNMAYLVRKDKATYLPFLVATGQQRTVYYLGMKYFAATPTGMWEAKERKIQTDRVTFGKTGTFLRLFRDGKHSYYGIHSFKYVNDWLGEEDRYKSLGCVVVSEEMMEVIEQSYHANGGYLKLTTTAGPQLFLQTITLREEHERVTKLTALHSGVIQ